MKTHTLPNKIAYALAAIAAAFLPLSYLVMIVSVCATIVPALLSGKEAVEPGGVVLWVLRVGCYGTLVQWPFYFLWAALTRQLTFRVRILWIVVLLFANMFAVPWFLFCMYHGIAQTAVTRCIGHESIRRYFEKG